MDLKIFPPDSLIPSVIELPLSKSESNRMLIISAMSPQGKSPSRMADCDDTDAMLLAIDRRQGCVNIGAAGTAMRFLTAFYAVTPGTDIELDGSERMRQRPIGPLVDALRRLGCDIDYLGKEGFPPLRIKGRMPEGGEATIDGSVSSQFVSALLMAAPAMEHGLKLTLEGRVVSRPYIDMTLALMRQAGIDARYDEDTQTAAVTNGRYSLSLPEVEADWSAASYWFAIAAISAEPVTLKGLRKESLQGDSAVAKLFEVTGLGHRWLGNGDLMLQLTPDAGSSLSLDLTETPDIVQTLAVTCCLLGLPFRFTGVESLRIKETDRLAALQMELSKLGFIIDIEEPGTLLWRGARYDPGEEEIAIDTYEDHRMAMAFAPAALFYPGLQINNAEVVTKSYPRFWADLRRVGFITEETSATPCCDD